MEDLEKLKYPVGKFERPTNFTKEQRDAWIKTIEELPAKLRKAVDGLSDEQLDTPYRPDGWTVRQVVHHMADSHMNAFIRLKLALTEDKPIIKPYQEALWANLPDSVCAPVDLSLNILESLHKRWVITLNATKEEDFDRIFIHPQYNREFILKENVALYAWHCGHHLAHILNLKKRMGW